MFKYYLLQQKVLWKLLEKIFITKKLNQCKASRTLKIDVIGIPDKMEKLQYCFQNMNCFSWIKLVQVPIH